MNKIRAGALFIVIVMALVIGILCASIMTISLYHQMHVSDNRLYTKLDDNVNSAVNMLLSDRVALYRDTSYVIDLFKLEEDSVFITRKRWGILESASVSAFSRGKKISVDFLYGYELSSKDSTVLYVPDLGRPLSFSGTTVIIGNCKLPASGVKRGNIEGEYFSGTQLVQGKVSTSTKNLPAIQEKTLTRLLSLLKGDSTSMYRRIGKLVYTLDTDTLINKFSDTTLVLLSQGTGLGGKYLEGNIIIYAVDKIEIPQNLTLKDVLIIAPYIRIKNNVQGVFQAFASDSMIVEENVVCNYPSVLGLMKTDFHVQQPYIKTGSNFKFSGIIFSYQNVSDLSQTLLSMGEKSEISGEIYANGFLELKQGTVVKGQVTCSKFYLKTKKAIYENNLLDITIDKTALSPYFVGSSLLISNTPKKIIKWLER
ncbi:MAG TPA: hypothetical protein VNW06_11670 [Cytophagaceae bacterium]|jgi:hypothetical protein|nr:hypothetical protein [Cytophagaceae bacterium]